jgi:hypothetical protein
MNQLVYLMGEAGTSFVKVGRTAHLSQRRASLQAGNPRSVVIHFTKAFPDERSAELFERDVQGAFAAQRRLGEWFEDSDGTLYAYFSAHTQRYVLPPPGRPIAVDKHDDLTEVPPHVATKFKKLVRSKGARLDTKTVQTQLHCTRAVARHLIKNLSRYAA